MNPFQLMEMMENFKEYAEQLQRDISPQWLLNAGTAMVISWVLRKSKEAGPPEGYAEKLKVTPQQAKTFYDLTLDAALSRYVTPAAKALPSGENHNGE